MTTTETETKVETQAQKEEALPEAVDSAKEQTEEKAAENSTPGSPTKKSETLKPVVTVHKKDFEKDVIYVYQFVRSAPIPSLSVACLKLETWLRITGLQYENVDHKLRYKSKKGQLPFVEVNGKEIDDVDFIIRELSKQFDKDLDSGLTEDQKTLSHAFESMLNNHTTPLIRWWRNNHPQEFLDATKLDIKQAFNSRFPNSILNIVFKFGFRKNLKDFGSHIGRVSDEEALESAKEDIKALSSYLGTKDYFFGKQIHLLDCVAFGALAQFIYVPYGGLKEWMETETPNLIAFVDRIKTQYWTDWDEICSTLEFNTHLPKKEVPAESTEEKANDEAAAAKKEEKPKKAKEEKKKKEKKEKKGKKDSTKEKSEEKDKEAPKEEAKAADVTEAPKEAADAPNGGEAPKTEVAASE